MPLFISYSHQDKDFTDELAKQLLLNNVYVWIDRWELRIGDSIIERVQKAIEGASALLVILSKASVASNWCNKEINVGLLRELEQRKIFVLPVLLEDCAVPIFLKDKLYADFRTNFDDGLRTVLEGIARFTNPYTGRDEQPEYYTDWAIDWGKATFLRFTCMEQAKGQPFSVLTVCEIVPLPTTVEKSKTNSDAEKDEHRSRVINLISQHLTKRSDIKIKLGDQLERSIQEEIGVGDDQYLLNIHTRRLGEDTGRDVLVNITTLMKPIFKHWINSGCQNDHSDRAK